MPSSRAHQHGGGGGEGKGGGGGHSLEGASLVALNSAGRRRRRGASRPSSAIASQAVALNAGRSPPARRASRQRAGSKPNIRRSSRPSGRNIRTWSRCVADRRAQSADPPEAGTVSGGRHHACSPNIRRRRGRGAQASRRGSTQLKGSVLNRARRRIQYNILQREVDTNRSLYDALLQRYKEIGVAGGIGTNTVSIVDRAEPPGGPYKPNLMLNLLIGFALGLLAGLGAALALEFLNDTIKTPDDVRDKLGSAFARRHPEEEGRRRRCSEELKDQTSPVSEAYFSLRTSLQFTTDTGAPKTCSSPARGRRKASRAPRWRLPRTSRASATTCC
jgi:succinoglycan biosynthesis transport protein ExoP